MYELRIPPDQLHQLWKLKNIRRRPMTKILRQILAEYFEKHQKELSTVVEPVTPMKQAV